MTTAKAKTSYYLIGSPFNGSSKQCSEKQAALIDEVITEFWGDDRSSQIRISIRHRGVAGNGQRCSANFPICWTRVHNPDDCTCNGFEDERGGTEIVITRGKPRVQSRRKGAV